MLLEIGQPIGHYTIVRLLHKSTWRHDYLGREQKSGNEAIVSIFTVATAQRETFMATLSQNSKTIEALRSPHFATVYSLGALRDDTPLVITAVPTGISLADSIKSDVRWSEPVRALTLIQSLVTLLHSAEIIPATLSAETIFIQPDNTLLITDAHLPISSDIQLATTHYAPPEQTVTAAPTEKGLIYRIGLLLYEMLAGEHPQALGWNMHADEAERMPPPSLAMQRSGLTQSSYDLVQISLHTQPEARFATLAEFTQRLTKAAESERIQQGLNNQLIKRKNVATTKKRRLSDPYQPDTNTAGDDPSQSAEAVSQKPRWLVPVMILMGISLLWLAGSFMFGQISAESSTDVNRAPTPTKQKGFTLINPLPGQFFTEGAPIYFSWSFGKALGPNESFHIKLYDTVSDATIDLDPVTRPLNGKTYQMQTVEIPVGEYEWQVGLYMADETTPLQSSIRLPISILADPELSFSAESTASLIPTTVP